MNGIIKYVLSRNVTFLRIDYTYSKFKNREAYSNLGLSSTLIIQHCMVLPLSHQSPKAIHVYPIYRYIEVLHELYAQGPLDEYHSIYQNILNIPELGPLYSVYSH